MSESEWVGDRCSLGQVLRSAHVALPLTVTLVTFYRLAEGDITVASFVMLIVPLTVALMLAVPGVLWRDESGRALIGGVQRSAEFRCRRSTSTTDR